mmetsp:Transcript_10129/g.14864  ORF Transcript_10129/g.14864 Transcript_10129/m.14864 type:complete len:134 (+) Transcript_10129:98-499(+)
MSSLKIISREEKMDVTTLKPYKLTGVRYFMYGTHTGPGKILNEVTNPEDGQPCLYAFAMEDYPEVQDISRLWGDTTKKYIYVFRFNKGRTVYTRGGGAPQDGEETEIDEPIKQTEILRVYTRLGGNFQFCDLS